MKQKRCKLRIHSISEGDKTLSSETQVCDFAVSFFRNLLSSGADVLEEPDHSLFPTIPDPDANEALCQRPTPFEIKDAVFGISKDSVPGLMDSPCSSFRPAEILLNRMSSVSCGTSSMAFLCLGVSPPPPSSSSLSVELLTLGLISDRSASAMSPIKSSLRSSSLALPPFSLF